MHNKFKLHSVFGTSQFTATNMTLKMSSFAVLLLLGLVSLSCAYPFHLPKCKDLTPMHNFNAEAYFKGTWYVTYGFQEDAPFFFPYLPGCISVKSKIIGPIVQENYTISFPGSKKEKYAVGLANLPGDVAKYVNQMDQATKDGIPLKKDPVRIDTVIIDTDYENYSVGYYCITDLDEGKLASTNFGILSRSPDPLKVHPNVEVALNKLGQQLSHFASTKGYNCPVID